MCCFIVFRTLLVFCIHKKKHCVIIDILNVKSLFNEILTLKLDCSGKRIKICVNEEEKEGTQCTQSEKLSN